ncbi:MAG TPA: prepilin-type N-terminal cleavage/methylation domain-containing protein [Pyrinomonadaceae bacterium]|jgi:type II secretory pathway pseudopilin PulG
MKQPANIEALRGGSETRAPQLAHNAKPAHNAELAQDAGLAQDERGFTLIETSIALVVMMVMALGAASLFAFSVYNNSGGSDRAQTLALAQQALERLRHAKFSVTGTDAILNAGTQTEFVRRGGQNPLDPQDPTGRNYRVVSTIDDNPATPGVDVNTLTTLKSVTVTVTPLGAGQSWATGAGGAVTVMTLRSKTDTP